MVSHYIYKITNLINGKIYVGKSKNPKVRWRQHKSHSKKRNTKLYYAMRKYGIENFIFEVLEELARVSRLNPKPFGGLQLILTGDFFQLPPIGNMNEPDTSAFCFESPLWHKVIPLDNHIELNTMFRQKDPKYIEIL